jgi:GNAT superfamily N-acetyltransferase
MLASARLSTAEEVLPCRVHYREEMGCQIVHDSIHRRPGWTLTYLLECGGDCAGYASVAIGGPWTNQPTLFEFYVLPEFHQRAFDLFESALATSGARQMEIQSNDTLLAVMLHTYAGNIVSEKIVFHDQMTTTLPAVGATLRRVTSEEQGQAHIEARQGGVEWVLEVDGAAAASGGILFHYNRPYGDIYMEVSEPFRRRGLGSYLVQELKRAAYRLGAVPCARCSPGNVASRKTLLKAGFVPFAHMLTGAIIGSSPAPAG